MSIVIDGAGTDEASWSPWLNDRSWPELDIDAVGGRDVVVLASHPDDEVLGAGGLIGDLCARGHRVAMVWATDGEASHPDSSAITRPALAAIRRAESCRALNRLGVTPAATHHLGLPDGRLATSIGDLRGALSRIVGRGDVVLAPWSGDGHPDHDTLGKVAESLAGTTTWHYPIWMWHWAKPDDDGVPWHRLRRTPVPVPRRKALALAEFRTQIAPLGPDVADAAILPPHVLRRFQRPSEWIFT